MFLEIACFNPTSALTALSAGADRIELCTNQHLGGTSPPFEWLEQIRSARSAEAVSTPIFVMIRPRGGTDFQCSAAEFETMQAAIARFRPVVEGFVFGILDEHRRVDVPRTTQLVRQAWPLPCTFHRAIDEVEDLERALEDVTLTGCCALLSSGGARNALRGREMLGRLVRRAAGRVVVMPGGDVRGSNLAELCRSTGALCYHSSAILPGSENADAAEIEAMKQVLGAARLE
jgi:copper homeostasis protein